MKKDFANEIVRYVSSAKRAIAFARSRPQVSENVRVISHRVWLFFLGTIALLGCLGRSFAFAGPAGLSTKYSVGPVSAPPVGSIIDDSNVDLYEHMIPAGLAFAIRHGMKVHIVPTQEIPWPAKYEKETEQYSSQVRLSSHATIQNYVAGLPFPSVQANDPNAAVKITYDWRLGPFIPQEISLQTSQKTSAYEVNPSEPGRLLLSDSDRDYRNENDCDHITIARNGLSGAAHDDSKTDSVEWKERASECGPDRGASITIQYWNPEQTADTWIYMPAVRKWREVSMTGGYPHQSCTYSCVQGMWEFLPPKTELYSVSLIGQQPVLACLQASGPAIQRVDGDRFGRFGSMNCQARDAYVLHMVPRDPAPENIIQSTVLIDSETYLYLGGYFFRDKQPDSSVPFWRIEEPTPGVVEAFLADDLYMPDDRKGFVLSLNLDDGTETINGYIPSKEIFNPRSQEYEPP